MSLEPKIVVHRLVEGLVKGHIPAELVDPTFEDHGVAIGLPRGIEALQDAAQKVILAFPDARLHVAESFVDEDRVVIRAVLEGTHRGPWEGNPPSGMPVRVPWLELWRVRDGRVVARWGGLDLGSLLQQIGALPMPEPV